MPRQTDTKQKIIEAALDLFSQEGFEPVSIRDIAAKVGIGNSALYKHFVSKQAILDSIVEKAVRETEQLFTDLSVPDTSTPQSKARWITMGAQEAAVLCARLTVSYLRNPFIARFRQLLCIERFRNESFNRMFQDFFINRQLTSNEEIFSFLMENNIVTGTSAKDMAYQFFAPTFLLQEQYGKDIPKLEEELIRQHVSYLEEHLVHDTKSNTI